MSALLCDFDGTLFHLPVDWTALRRALGLAPDAAIGPVLQECLDAGDEDRLGVVVDHELAAVARGCFVHGAVHCLRAAARAQLKVAIVTRNSRHAVLAALARAGLGSLPVVGREDVRRLKPDPEGLHVAMALLGASPKDTVLVGDTHHDVAAARAAGVRSTVVRNPLLACPPAGADRYADNLPDALCVAAW